MRPQRRSPRCCWSPHSARTVRDGLSDAALPTWLRCPDADELQSYFDFATWAAGSYGTSLATGPADAATDRIVQLSTCMLPAEEGARYVVTGVLVDEEEL